MSMECSIYHKVRCSQPLRVQDNTQLPGEEMRERTALRTSEHEQHQNLKAAHLTTMSMLRGNQCLTAFESINKVPQPTS